MILRVQRLDGRLKILMRWLRWQTGDPDEMAHDEPSHLDLQSAI